VAVAPFTARVPVIGGFGPARTMNVPAVTDDGSIASLKVTVSAEVVATLVAPREGLVAVTVGSVVSGAVPVVKVQIRGAAIGTPVRSLMPRVNCTVYVVVPLRGAVGENVAVVPERDTVPVTVGVRKNVAVVTVAGSTGSLKVAVRDDDSETSEAPPIGVVVVTVGAPVPLPAAGEALFLGASQLAIPDDRAAITSNEITVGMNGRFIDFMSIAQ